MIGPDGTDRPTGGGTDIGVGTDVSGPAGLTG